MASREEEFAAFLSDKLGEAVIFNAKTQTFDVKEPFENFTHADELRAKLESGMPLATDFSNVPLPSPDGTAILQITKNAMDSGKFLDWASDAKDDLAAIREEERKHQEADKAKQQDIETTLEKNLGRDVGTTLSKSGQMTIDGNFNRQDAEKIAYELHGDKIQQGDEWIVKIHSARNANTDGLGDVAAEIKGKRDYEKNVAEYIDKTVSAATGHETNVAMDADGRMTISAGFNEIDAKTIARGLDDNNGYAVGGVKAVKQGDEWVVVAAPGAIQEKHVKGLEGALQTMSQQAADTTEVARLSGHINEKIERVEGTNDYRLAQSFETVIGAKAAKDLLNEKVPGLASAKPDGKGAFVVMIDEGKLEKEGVIASATAQAFTFKDGQALASVRKHDKINGENVRKQEQEAARAEERKAEEARKAAEASAKKEKEVTEAAPGEVPPVKVVLPPEGQTPGERLTSPVVVAPEEPKESLKDFMKRHQEQVKKDAEAVGKRIEEAQEKIGKPKEARTYPQPGSSKLPVSPEARKPAQNKLEENIDAALAGKKTVPHKDLALGAVAVEAADSVGKLADKVLAPVADTLKKGTAKPAAKGGAAVGAEEDDAFGEAKSTMKDVVEAYQDVKAKMASGTLDAESKAKFRAAAAAVANADGGELTKAEVKKFQREFNEASGGELNNAKQTWRQMNQQDLKDLSEGLRTGDVGKITASIGVLDKNGDGLSAKEAAQGAARLAAMSGMDRKVQTAIRNMLKDHVTAEEAPHDKSHRPVKGQTEAKHEHRGEHKAPVVLTAEQRAAQKEAGRELAAASGQSAEVQMGIVQKHHKNLDLNGDGIVSYSEASKSVQEHLKGLGDHERKAFVASLQQATQGARSAGVDKTMHAADYRDKSPAATEKGGKSNTPTLNA